MSAKTKRGARITAKRTTRTTQAFSVAVATVDAVARIAEETGVPQGRVVDTAVRVLDRQLDAEALRFCAEPGCYLVVSIASVSWPFCESHQKAVKK
jgi:hypothetical protein